MNAVSFPRARSTPNLIEQYKTSLSNVRLRISSERDHRMMEVLLAHERKLLTWLGMDEAGGGG